MNSMMALRTQRSEAGFALIEVIVAAAVLAVVALAVLSGIDGATSASAREKARAVAANLAEQDQERLRAMPIEVLRNPPQSGLNADGKITVDGVTYNVESEARWITDDLGGDPKCGSSSNQVEYLHIVTTVTSRIVGREMPAVSVDSLVAPTTEFAEGHGVLGLKVVDRTTSKGVAGIMVSAISDDGYAPPQQVTDPDGCAVFSSVPVGNYTLKVDQPGYLDRYLNQDSDVNQTVAAKTVSFAQLQYDRATSARVAVKTHVPGKTFTTAGAMDSKATNVSMTNGAYVGMLRTVNSASPTTSVDVVSLFPYAENSYTFFTGKCGFTSPDTYKTANPNYFTNTNPAAALLADPAKPQPQVATVQQPPVNLRVQRNYAGSTTANFSDSDVTVLAKLYRPAGSSDACDEPVFTLGTQGWPSSGWGTVPRTTVPAGTNAGINNNHWVSQTGTFDPGLPFGRYKFCVIDRVAKRTAIWPNTSTSNATDFYDNTLANGGAAGDINLSSWSSSSSSIPTTCNWPAAP